MVAESGEMGPRSARGLIADAFRLYRRYPLLFLALAAAVLVPYDLVVLALTGSGPLTRKVVGFGTESLLWGLDMFLVTALISALHVHAVAAVREGVEPRLLPVAKRGLRVLPVVAAATIVAQLGIVLGSILIVPGVILFLRWSVVAQAAAIEHEGWLPALRRSWALTESRYRHVLAFLGLTFLITGLPPFAASQALRDEATTPLTFVAGIAVQSLASSFAALATAFLYYDLRVRRRALAAEASAAVSGADRSDAGDSVGPSTVSMDARQGSWDPRVYADPERPSGWYVVPHRPHRMRYWLAGEAPAWQARSARTPRKVREEWEREVGLRNAPT